MATETENQIVVYQPNETIRLDVRLENETVWLTQAQLCELFQRDVSVISRHIKNIFSEGELEKESNLHFLQIANSDRPVALYSLDVIISVGYRVKSVIGTRFRQWANKVLKEYILRGYAVNERLERLERKVIKHDEQINLVLQTALPPIQGVFYDGQIYDAFEQMKKFVRMAKKELIVIDPYFDDSVLPLIAQKRKGVSVLVVKSPQNKKLHGVDVAKFNAQYANSLTIKDSIRFHDRFLIIDQTTLIHVGASLNYLGKRCFAFSSLDKSNIPDILAKI